MDPVWKKPKKIETQSCLSQCSSIEQKYLNLMENVRIFTIDDLLSESVSDVAFKLKVSEEVVEDILEKAIQHFGGVKSNIFDSKSDLGPRLIPTGIAILLKSTTL